MKSAHALWERFQPLATDKPVLERKALSGTGAGEFRSVHWIRPEVLCKVTFTEWTEDGHIRHPLFPSRRSSSQSRI